MCRRKIGSEKISQKGLTWAEKGDRLQWEEKVTKNSERWAKIKGTDYEVSDQGAIRSEKRVLEHRMKVERDSRGYETVRLRINGVRKVRGVAKLVREAFGETASNYNGGRKPPKMHKRMTERRASEVRMRMAAGESQAKVAKDYGITRQMAGRIAAGLNWAEPREKSEEG